jgi:hypothetical protein
MNGMLWNEVYLFLPISFVVSFSLSLSLSLSLASSPFFLSFFPYLFSFFFLFQMLRGDFLRFFLIYSVFLIGFSQAFYIIFNETGMGSFMNRLKISFIAMLGGV